MRPREIFMAIQIVPVDLPQSMNNPTGGKHLTVNRCNPRNNQSCSSSYIGARWRILFLHSSVPFWYASWRHQLRMLKTESRNVIEDKHEGWIRSAKHASSLDFSGVFPGRICNVCGTNSRVEERVRNGTRPYAHDRSTRNEENLSYH